jgi:hypothetical protein
MIPLRPSPPRLVRYARSFWLAALLGAIATDQSLAAEAEAPSAPVQAVALTYQETAFSFVNQPLPLTNETTPFAREPGLGSEVYRGKLRLGGGEAEAVAFLWDRKAGQLHLDLNHNLDLTDDDAGIFMSLGGRRGNYQTFTNVHLPLPAASANPRLSGDLAVWEHRGHVSVSFALRSLWQGRAVLPGGAWQVGLIETFVHQPVSVGIGYLLVRPWTQHEQPFSLYDGSLRAVSVAPRLFLDGQGYRLRWTNELSGQSNSLRLEFAAEQSVLGEAHLTGAFIDRLVLEGDQSLVLLDQPGPVVRLPVGSYSAPKVWLQSGESGAFEQRRPQDGLVEPQVTVTETTPVLLDIGGPLTNSVVVTRRGQSLHLSYQLVGRGGRVYSLRNQDRSVPPEFTVYQRGRKVGSGKFEFG